MHIPVMLTEALEALNVQPNHWYLDGTFGGGGHTQAILKQGGKVVAFDFDEEAIAVGQVTLAKEVAAGDLILVRENFDRLEVEVEKLLKAKTIAPLAGALFDFGTNSDQLTSTTRGFSFFGQDQELDMRLDTRLGVQAKDLLMVLSEKQLTELFREYGGEDQAHSIAKAIVKTRKAGEYQRLQTVSGLVQLIERVKRGRRGHLHPATKIFQALRIAVNDELGNIERALPQAARLLAPGAHLVTIAFHEGEDRVAKRLFTEWEKNGEGKNLYKHPLTPSETEVLTNSKARSAKLRSYERITQPTH